MFVNYNKEHIKVVLDLIINKSSKVGYFWEIHRDEIDRSLELLSMSYDNYIFFNIIDAYKQVFSLYGITCDKEESKGSFYLGRRIMVVD